MKKEIKSYGLRVNNDDEMLVPAYDENGKLWSFQRIFEIINKNGKKEFTKKIMKGSKKKGCFFIIDPENKINNSEEILICEGYATGASLYECTSIPTVIAFDVGSLKPVSQAIRRKFKNKNIIICADNDQYNTKNIGIEKAKEAAFLLKQA